MNPNAARPQRFDRHYRLPATGVWVGRGLMALYALSTLPFVLGIAAAVGVVLLVIIGVIAVWMERLFARGGMYETDTGLRIVTGWGSKTVSWENIAAFRQSATVPRSRVLIVDMSGAVSPIVGTAQGARIRWRDGETRDIVAVLNSRLEEWRQAHPRLGRRG